VYGCKGDKRYVENLVLKGGMFLYTISNYEGRPTMDIDFMLRRMSNDVAGMERIMENITTAESRIRDTDMAEEMVNYSKNDILAQANQSNQGVLSLLQ
jgi:hypothetical protein